MTDRGDKRESRALELELITDPQLKAETEAANGLRQFDLGIQIVQEALDRGADDFRLRPSLLLSLHREALAGLSGLAGTWRPGDIEITNARHTPPKAYLVPELIEGMCDYVNDNWSAATPIHLGAYVMWRLNWIHPFTDGNGRTSRIGSYVVMSISSRAVLPGAPSIPDQISSDKPPYFEALEDADAQWKDGQLNVSKMEWLLETLLAKQLTNFFQSAGGKLPPLMAP